MRSPSAAILVGEKPFWTREDADEQLRDSGVFPAITDHQRARELIASRYNFRISEFEHLESGRFVAIYRVFLQEKKGQPRKYVTYRVYENSGHRSNPLFEQQVLAMRKAPSVFPLLLDAHLANDRSYICTEYLEGELVDHFLRRPLQQAHFVSIFRQIASILSVIHRSGMLHLDLKPSNFLMSKERRRVVCLDIGAWIPPLGGKAGILISTHRYVDPQMRDRSRGPDRLADIYSFGVSLLEGMLDAGGGPGMEAYRTNAARILEGAQKQRHPFGSLLLLALRCIHPDSQVRPASLADLEQELSKVPLSDEPMKSGMARFLDSDAVSIIPGLRNFALPRDRRGSVMTVDRLVPLVGLLATAVITAVGLASRSQDAWVFTLIFGMFTIISELLRGLTAWFFCGGWSNPILKGLFERPIAARDKV